MRHHRTHGLKCQLARATWLSYLLYNPFLDNMPILEVKDLSAGYGNGPVIQDVSFSVESGRVRHGPRPERLGQEHAHQGHAEARPGSPGRGPDRGDECRRLGKTTDGPRDRLRPPDLRPRVRVPGGRDHAHGTLCPPGTLRRPLGLGLGSPGGGPPADPDVPSQGQIDGPPQRRRKTAGLYRPGPGPGHAPAFPRRAQLPSRHQLPGRDLRDPSTPREGKGEDHPGRRA